MAIVCRPIVMGFSARNITQGFEYQVSSRQAERFCRNLVVTCNARPDEYAELAHCRCQACGPAGVDAAIPGINEQQLSRLNMPDFVTS